MYEVAYQIFDSKGRLVIKRKGFKTAIAREKFINQLFQDCNFYSIYGTRDP